MSESARLPFAMRLFGSLHVSCEGQSLRPLRSQKGKWLLALLTLRHGREIQRTWLADQLWPDSSQPLASLNMSLSDLCRALGGEAVRIIRTPRTLCLDLTGADVDVIAFDAAIQQATPPALLQAVNLYTAPLLQDCMETWVLQEREARKNAYASALETLAAGAMADGDRAEAIRFLRKAVAIEAAQEKLHRWLMEILTEAGDYTGALQVYRDLQMRLQTEFRRAPEEATTALHQHIRQMAHRRAGTPICAPSGVAPPSPSNLPHPLTPLLGRNQDLNEIVARIPGTRLVTLTGTGGVGKTRLATAAALEIAAHFAHGAHLVKLDALTDPDLIPQHTARTLGVEGQPGHNWTETLMEFLRGRQLLLLLDNCEHLIGAAADFARQLLTAASGLHILATSRERLGLMGEAVWIVPPLAIPQGAIPTDIQQYLDYPAIHLFYDRAVAVRADFALSPHNAVAISHICRHLDGLPLAIELAAALTTTLSVHDIAAHLNDRFRLLQSGDRTAPQRHQALKTTLNWSYDQLTAPEQTLLCRLSVFAGGWTLAAADALSPTQSSQKGAVIGLLSRLVSKSLVLAKEEPAGMRYDMLETIREYGRELLSADLPQWRQSRQKHGDYYLALAETAAPELLGPDQAAWLETLERESDNLRAALSWATEAGATPEPALRLGIALLRFWYARGYYDEGQDWLQRILQMPGHQPPELRLKTVHNSGNLHYAQYQHAAARSCFEEALKIARETGDRRATAAALASLANVDVREKLFASARIRFEEGHQLFEALGDRHATATVLSSLAMVACQGEKDYAAARELHQRGLALYRELGSLYYIAQECINLAYTLTLSEDTESAYTYLNEGLALSRTLKNPHLFAHCLTNYSGLAIIEGRWERAAVLIGADFALRAKIDACLPEDAMAEYRRDEQRLRAELGDAAFEAYLKQGGNLTEEEVQAIALAYTDQLARHSVPSDRNEAGKR
jgi:non-specific serine/threonine protein kinase